MGTARRLALQFLQFLVAATAAASAPPDSTVLVMPVYEVHATRLGARELLDLQNGFASLLEAELWDDGSFDASSALARALGVQTRSRGALGASASLSVRGSTSTQVPIYLDGILLNDPDDGGVDLGTIDLHALERMEVHRSAAPLLQGGSSLGGAVHLFSRSGTMPFRMLTGGGSYGERFLESGGSGKWNGDWVLAARGRVAFGEGDWEVFDDKGTQYNPDDDEWTRRVNNDAQNQSLLVRAARPWRGGRLSVIEQWHRRELGDPGPLHHSPSRVRYGERSQSLQSTWTRDAGTLRSLRAHHRVEMPFFEDPLAEFGYPSAYRARVDQYGVGARGGWRGLAREFWRVDWRSERLRSSEEAQRSGRGRPQWRHSAELALEPTLQRGPWRLQLGMQLALHHERVHSTPETNPLPTGELEIETRGSHVGQIAVRRELGRRWSLKSSLAHSQRLPSMVELYGARGGVLSNPELEPESAWLFDLGVVARPFARARLELALFHNEYEDLISFRPISARAVKAANVASARSRGVELQADLTLPAGFSESIQWQLLDTEDRSDDVIARGKSLVGRPRYELTQRLGARWGAFTAEYEVVAVGDSFFESGERNRIDSQLLHGVRAGWRLGRAGLHLHLANLGDERLSDVWRYPLPGRSVRLSLSLHGEQP